MDNNNVNGQDSPVNDQVPSNYFPKGDQGGGFRIQLHQSDIPPGTIKARHIEAWIIFSGLSANRPTTHTTNVKSYFALDTNKLWIDNGTTWVGTVLS